MSYLKSLWNQVPTAWQERLYGAVGGGIAVYGGPAAKEVAGVVWECLRAHYGF